MESLIFDSGIKEYAINGGDKVLRISPADPNLYARYLESLEKIEQYEKEMKERAEGISGDDKDYSEKVVLLMRDYDKLMKGILNEVFGCGNDFDDIFEGVNLIAVAENGDMIINNFMAAVEPIIENGTKNFVASKISEAKKNRAQRRASK